MATPRITGENSRICYFRAPEEQEFTSHASFEFRRLYRGRVMGVRMMAIYGLPLGLLASGVLIEWFGYVATASGYCVFGLAATVAIGVWWRESLWPSGAPGVAGYWQ